MLHTVSSAHSVQHSWHLQELSAWRSSQCGHDQCILLPSTLTLCWACCRAEGRFQLSDGWKPFAQHWKLGHGGQLQLSRCFVSGGCIWLDVKIMRHSLSGAPVAISKHFKHAHVHIVSMTMLILRTCDLPLTSSSVNSTLLATR